jgi:hypothetical protein
LILSRARHSAEPLRSLADQIPSLV